MAKLPHLYLKTALSKSQKSAQQLTKGIYSLSGIIASFITFNWQVPVISAQVVIPTIPTTIPSQPPVKLSNQTKVAPPQIIFNGRTFNGAWLLRPAGNKQQQIYISDAVLAQQLGVDLLSTSTPLKQPMQWFSTPTATTTLLANGYRYLNITSMAKRWGWQMETRGNQLLINTKVARIQQLAVTGNSLPTSNPQILISLSHSTPWQIRQELPRKIQGDPDEVSKPITPPNRDWTITLDGIADEAILQRYAPTPPTPIPPVSPILNHLKQLTPIPPAPPIPTPTTTPTVEPLVQSVEIVNQQTIIRLSVPFGFVPRVSTKMNNTPAIQINIAADAFANRQIAWADGITWRQQMMSLGSDRFPVNWLEINPRRTQISLRPIVTNNTSQQGTAPLLTTAQQYAAVAAINGGYFNRNNRLPLGAIRQNNQWLSGPILNRGAIAWNNSGQFYFGRLALTEQLIAGTNPAMPILYLNSGYVQSGISRYTPTWGTNYTTMTNNEVLLTVQNNRISKQITVPTAGEQSEPIPRDGYLLVFRGTATQKANALVPGTSVRIEAATQPSAFNRFPHIIGAGPLLIQNRQIVLDGEADKFSRAFISQKAVRSAICNLSNGNIVIAAIHNRAAAAGPTLQEHAQLMQKLGCVNALNLDGGSSTSLYLGGQLIDRSANTAARVHNGIGIFLAPKP